MVKIGLDANHLGHILWCQHETKRRIEMVGVGEGLHADQRRQLSQCRLHLCQLETQHAQAQNIAPRRDVCHGRPLQIRTQTLKVSHAGGHAFDNQSTGICQIGHRAKVKRHE